jgi:hypothetical protein
MLDETLIVLPGVSRRVLVATKEYPRFSEGDVVPLTDGRLLLAVARKEGAGDFASGTIIGLFSSDDGLSWDDAPHVIRKPWDDVVDVMSVSCTCSSWGEAARRRATRGFTR